MASAEDRCHPVPGGQGSAGKKRLRQIVGSHYAGATKVGRFLAQ